MRETDAAIRADDYVLKDYGLDRYVLDMEPYGGGHINDTYLVRTSIDGAESRYVLQRVNTYVFKNPLLLMKNIQEVTEFLRNRINSAGGDPDRETLNLIPALDGQRYCIDKEDGFWRLYKFVEGTNCYSAARSAEDFYECGHGFGTFQYLLSDYPVGNLSESIPDFHNTVKRYQAFKDAVAGDPHSRTAGCLDVIAFALEREDGAGAHVTMQKNGLLPLRVTHNDTKLNNVLMDAVTGKAVCVVDLDTVMPGLAVNDFGDAIRYGANTAAEDERDLSLVSLNLPYFESFSRGFLTGSRGKLTPAETDNLAAATKLMTLECGVRFLTDHLMGDAYFKIHRPGHNLDRARSQFALVRDMERKMDAMNAIIKKVKKELTNE